MVTVLVLGASGYIGYAVCTALRRAGHIVHGVVRDPSSKKAAGLRKEEVIVHRGDLEAQDLEPRAHWSKLIDSLRVEVVIDAAATSLGVVVFEAVLTVARAQALARGPCAPKLTYIYTSGTWVHGNSRRQVSDRSILPYFLNRQHISEGIIEPEDKHPPPRIITSWRPALEERILSPSTREVLDVVIIRPGDVFGGVSPDFSMWFDPLIKAIATKSQESAPEATSMQVLIMGKRDALLATVHRDDLAEAYRLIIEKSSMLASLSYPVFDIANPVESLQQIITAAAKTLGVNTGAIKYVDPPEGGWVEAMSTSTVVSCERARDLLGWIPRHPSLTGGMEVYMTAYIANRVA
jgi:nucleoside-diphosphate-sugar epimerase